MLVLPAVTATASSEFARANGTVRIGFSRSAPARLPQAAARWKRASRFSSRSAATRLREAGSNSYRGYRRQPSRSKDQDAGTGRAQQGACDHSATGHVSKHWPSTITSERGAGPAHYPTSAARTISHSKSALITCFMRLTAAQPIHVLGEYAAKNSAIGASRQSPTISLTATKDELGSSETSRTTAARSCRSCGHH